MKASNGRAGQRDEKADFLFQKSLRRRPDNAVAHVNYGIAPAHLNRAAEARQELETAVRLAAAANDSALQRQAAQLLEQIGAR